MTISHHYIKRLLLTMIETIGYEQVVNQSKLIKYMKLLTDY